MMDRDIVGHRWKMLRFVMLGHWVQKNVYHLFGLEVILCNGQVFSYSTLSVPKSVSILKSMTTENQSLNSKNSMDGQMTV